MTEKEKNSSAPSAEGERTGKFPIQLNIPPRLRRPLLIAGCVLLVLLVGLILWNSLFEKPELPGQSQFNPPVTGGDPSPGTTSSDPPVTGGEPEQGLRPKSEGERKSKDFYTVLILGRDTVGGGTDTILLASYDVTNQKASVMSIPRDTMVNVPWDVKKINSVYNRYGGGENGIQMVYQEIAQLVGFEPDFRIIVEWEAVGEIVDAMDGVWFDVPYHMDYDDPDQDLHIHQEKGYRLLSGEDAMQVIRWRKNNANSPHGVNGVGDLGRMKLQQDFLKALIGQLVSVKNVANISPLAEVFQKNVTTDLSFQNILWFARQAITGGLSVSNVNFTTMPLKGVYAWSRYYETELDYVVPDAGKLLELVNSQLSPFAEEFTLRELDIMCVNTDGSVSSSTGYVEDTPATYPLSHWKPTPSEQPTQSPTAEDPSSDTP